jgi:beta-lactamase class A
MQRAGLVACSLTLVGALVGGCASQHQPAPANGPATNDVVSSQAASGGKGPDGLTPANGVHSPTPASAVKQGARPLGTASADISNEHVSAAELAAKVKALVESAPAHVAIEMSRADGTTLYEQNSEDLYDAASLYKLGIMVQVYKDRDDGTLTFDDPVTLSSGFFYESDEVYSPDTDVDTDVPVGDLLRNMITLSSNVAAEALLNLVGTDEVNQTMADLGLVNTKILWSPVAGRSPDGRTTMASVDTGVSPRLVPIISRSVTAPDPLVAESSADSAYDLTTASDMASLFEQLLSGTVLSQSTSAEMLDLLTEQLIDNRLPADLPSGTKVAHKTGDLDGLLHDAGVIYAPAGPIVVVVMTDEITDNDAILDLFHQIGALAYEYTP